MASDLADPRAPHGRAWLTVLALLTAAASGGALAWFHLTLLGPLRIAASGGVTPELLAGLEAADRREVHLLLALLVTTILCAVVFFRWLVAAVRVARAVDPLRATTTPAGAVLWWFVPLFNLLKPYLIVRRLYTVSAGRPGVPLSFGLWWSTWIGASLLDVAARRIAGADPDLDTLIVATRVELVSDVLWAVSALLAIVVVLRITGAQRRALRR